MREKTVLIAFVFVLAACGDDTPTGPNAVASIDVTSADSFTVVGDTVRFSATALDAVGSSVAKPSVTWSSTPNTVATIDATGLVQAVGEGEATITATVGSVTGMASVTVADSQVTYTVTFEATWSAATHPVSFPTNPHFSGLIGGTHNADLVVWQLGSPASPGIKDMAELGAKSPLDTEIEAAIQSGTAWRVLSGSGINPSPASVSLTFEIHADFPLISLVSMIAPSPDWFVGVSSISLVENGVWVDQKMFDLKPYDAGTDNGVIYTSANSATIPPEPISRIDTSPFDLNQVLGTFTFERQQ